MKYKITWEASDGYVGGSRPHSFIFDSNDRMDDDEWEELTEEQKQEIFDEETEIEFQNKVSYGITNIKELENGI